MHIGVDVREACSPTRTGKGQWTYGFVTELLKRSIDLTLFTDRTLPDEWKTLIVSHRGICAIHRSDLKGLAWHREAAAVFTKKKDMQAYLSPVSFIVPYLAGKKKKVIPVVHDMIAFRGEPHDKRAVFIEKFTLKRALKYAPLVLTISETTKADILKKFPSIDPAKITCVYAAGDAGIAAQPKEGSSIVMMSTLSPRKNQKKLIEAYAMLPDELKQKHPLVLIGGRGWKDEDIVALAKKTKGVSYKGYLSSGECAKEMEKALLVAYPSNYEGFGLPLLDAMNAGIPVLTSDVGSMKEVAGDAALLVDPDSTQSIRDGLQKLLGDKTLRDEFRKKGIARAKEFSWKKSVDIFLESLQKLSTAGQ